MVRVLAVAGALLVVAQLHRAGGGVISSELNLAFGLGAAEIGVVIGAMMLASAVVQVPMGLALDRYARAAPRRRSPWSRSRAPSSSRAPGTRPGLPPAAS